MFRFAHAALRGVALRPFSRYQIKGGLTSEQSTFHVTDRSNRPTSMPVSKHSQSAEPNARALLRALLALSLGWLLLPVIEPAAQGRGEEQGVQTEAELRVGEQAPAPVADIASARASLRALNARIRTGADQPLADPQWLSALLVPAHQRGLAQHADLAPTQDSLDRVAARHWPLPRSSCHADDEPSAAAADSRS
jgi:hypothetical protein